MNNREGVNRKKEYYEWLKAVVDEPLDEDYKASVATFMDLDSISDEAKETIKLSTEVVQPFTNALAYIVNNRFIIEDKAFLMENDTDDPPMTPLEIFAVLDYLIPSTVREFLGVLKVDSVVMEKLFGLWFDDDTDGFSASLQKENCDLTRISRLCRCCWDDAFSVSEIPNSEVPMMMDALSSNLKHNEKRDEQQVKESASQMLESMEEIEASEEDGEDYDLEESFRDYRQFCELIYLVRFLSDRGDYRKMRRFFTGPEWVKDRDSSYANAADSEFRRQMSEFYPEVCKFVV